MMNNQLSDTKLTERIYSTYTFLVRYQFKKYAKKTDKVYGESKTFLSSDASRLAVMLKDYCKKRSYKLESIISYQALRVESAFYQDREGMPYLSKQECGLLPIPEDGKEVYFKSASS